MLYKHYINCSKFTVRVYTNEKGTIYQGPRIVRRFIGKSVKDLLYFSRDLGNFKHIVTDVL